MERRLKPGKDALPPTLPSQTVTLEKKPAKDAPVSESRYRYLSDWDVSKGSRTFLPVYEPPGPSKRRNRKATSSQQVSGHFHSLERTVEPTPCSFPRRSLDNPPVGPTSYSPEFRRVKPAPQTAFFGKLTSKRFDDHTYPYGVSTTDAAHSTRKQAKLNWFFLSGTSRSQAFETSTENPGPGQYKPLEYIGKATTLPFRAAREQPLSNDPHRPYASNLAPNPPIGSYKTIDDLVRQKRLRERLSPLRDQPQSPPFGVAEERFNKFSMFGSLEDSSPVVPTNPTKFQVMAESPLH